MARTEDMANWGTLSGTCVTSSVERRVKEEKGESSTRLDTTGSMLANMRAVTAPMLRGRGRRAWAGRGGRAEAAAAPAPAAPQPDRARPVLLAQEVDQALHVEALEEAEGDVLAVAVAAPRQIRGEAHRASLGHVLQGLQRVGAAPTVSVKVDHAGHALIRTVPGAGGGSGNVSACRPRPRRARTLGWVPTSSTAAPDLCRSSLQSRAA